MRIIYAVLILLVLLGIKIAYTALKHVIDSSGGSCISITTSQSQYTCNCALGKCPDSSGIYDPNGTCIGDFIATCKAQLIGTCRTSTGCSYPSILQDCTAQSGTFQPGPSTCT